LCTNSFDPAENPEIQEIKYLGVSFLDAKIGATHLGYIRAGSGCGKETIEREGASAKTNSLATFNIYTSAAR